MLCRWKWISALTFLSMNLSTQHSGRVEIYAACFRLKTCHPEARACYKSEDAGWDIPIWLLAKCLGLVMNAAVTHWSMKNEAHHYLLSIKPENFYCFLFFFSPQGSICFWLQINISWSSFLLPNLDTIEMTWWIVTVAEKWPFCSYIFFWYL